MTRISVDLNPGLVERLAVQVDCSGIDRRTIIDSAVRALLGKWEQIDREEGRPCTCGLLDHRGQRRGTADRPHLPDCRWAPPASQ